MNKIDSIKGELEKIWGSKVYVMKFNFDINSYCDAKDYDRRFSVIFNDKKSIMNQKAEFYVIRQRFGSKHFFPGENVIPPDSWDEKVPPEVERKVEEVLNVMLHFAKKHQDDQNIFNNDWLTFNEHFKTFEDFNRPK